MTLTGAGSPTCRELRQLLGVYVVGAIDPAERSLVDEHLGTCSSCRDELAGLAGLPAMLSRVPADDVARMEGTVVALPEHHEPSPELLDSLLGKVTTRRRTRRWRGAAAVAAAAVIAAGGTAIGLGLTSSTAAAWSAASAMSSSTHASAVVDFASASAGTQMKVRVSGIQPGTRCQFWILTGNGAKAPAGSWTVEPASYMASPWYHSTAAVSPSSVHGFQITAAGKVLVTIPAA
jgi:predicted anti-sigma-YlaC factor YlaD